MHIPLSSPDITEIEKKYVLDVLNTSNLSLGPKLPEFEARVADYVGTRYAVAVNSGTSGLHCCIKALGIGDDDLVITTPFSFVASANCILFERAKPVFVDIDPLTYNIDATRLEKTIHGLGPQASKLKALLPVHVFGHPCDMNKIGDIARKYNLKIIEDACEALGAEFNGKKVGTFGDCGVFAFYPNKQMTTGEGGVVITDKEYIASLCRSLRNQGRDDDSSWLAHARLGYNYRLSDINCALGIAQLERIDEILAKRARVAEMYNQRLKDLGGIRTPFKSKNIKMSWFVYVVLLDEKYNRDDRDKILLGLREKGIGCNNYFVPIHLQPFYMDMFGYRKGDFPVTEHTAERTIALPFYNNLQEHQIDYVVKNLKTLL